MVYLVCIHLQKWVVTKRKYTIDIPNSKLDLVSEITTKKTVVNEVGESYYPHMFYDLNQVLRV